MAALRAFVHLLAGSGPEHGLRMEADSSLARSLALHQWAGSGGGALPWSSVTGLLAVYKQFWLAVPLEVFDERCPDVRPFARVMAASLLKSTDPNDIRAVSVLLKRLRRYGLFGRIEDTVTKREMLAMLADQRHRCAACGHRFTVADMQAYEYRDEANIDEQAEGLRPPHVDHIVPLFLGGNAPDNLQLLCSTCNLGKGAAVAWPLRSAMFKPFRPSDLLSLSPALRWMTLARDGKCAVCARRPEQFVNDEELLVSRLEDSRGWLIENTRSVCGSCLATNG